MKKRIAKTYSGNIIQHIFTFDRRGYLNEVMGTQLRKGNNYTAMNNLISKIDEIYNTYRNQPSLEIN